MIQMQDGINLESGIKNCKVFICNRLGIIIAQGVLLKSVSSHVDGINNFPPAFRHLDFQVKFSYSDQGVLVYNGLDIFCDPVFNVY